MQASLLSEFGAPPQVQTVPDPTCPPDGAIIAVRACGVCRSDHHAWKGVDPDVRLPHVMGHEFAGTVQGVGPDCHGFAIGDRVTAPFILGCGACGDCKAGQPTICDTQQVIGFTGWGAFADYVAVSAADYNLVALPDAVEFDVAAAMGCRVTTAWRALTERGGLQPSEWLAVQGCGGVGLSALMIAKALGARVVAIDIAADALAMARRFGADVCLDAATGDVAQAVRDATDGGAHLSVDALGLDVTFANSLRSLRKLGRHVQIGMPVGNHATVLLPLLDLVYSRQLSLHGTRGLGAPGFAGLLRLIEAGQLNLTPLITERITLDGVGNALARMDGGQPAGITIVDRFGG